MATAPLTFEGKANPLTVITPMQKWRTWAITLLLITFARFSKLTTVRQLEFIHFARWLCVRGKDFPRVCERQPRERLHRDYYVFATNFNGPWDQYIDTFALLPDVRRGMFFLWIASENFPGPWPIRTFKRYIHYNTYPLDLYYNAYPHATVRGINAALEVEKRLEAFREDVRGVTDPEVFEEKFRAFEDGIVDHLSSAGHERVPSTLLSRPQNMHL